MERTTELATFGAGCFWGVELSFGQLPGVVETQVGYEGGHLAQPTYREVCSDETGHAEVVQIEFDPSQVSYESLVSAFFELHDPTQFNRQGPDVGAQYRSVIFYHSEEQRQVAEALKRRLEEAGRFSRPIVTSIEPAQTFWPAEDYHQKYLEKRGMKSCRIH